MVRPSPVPWPRSAAPVRNRCGPSRSSFAGKPGPRSRTVTVFPQTSTVTGSPPCRRALTSRFVRIRSRRRTSVRTGAGQSAPTSSAATPARRVIVATSGPSACTPSCASSRRASSRATSSRSSVSVRSAATRSRTSSVGRPAGSSSAAVCSPVSGVRNSCATSAVNRCSASSRCCRLAAIVSTAEDSSATSFRVPGTPDAPMRASSSPSLIRRAVSAAVLRSLLSRLASSAPPIAASVTTPAPEATSCLSRSASSACSPANDRRTDSTWSPPTGRAAHTAGSDPDRSR
ncbi:hypothetical protein EDD91_5109 [Streptomyces sp. KS 21]|nr:hypothetical protein EDD91_5109 [Streptomyces sp. KS 21]